MAQTSEINSLNTFWGSPGHDMVVVGYQDVKDFNAENILPQPEHKLNEIRDWLNPTDYAGEGSEYQKHLSSHLDGTGTWIYDTAAYAQWHGNDDHGILWVRGTPGSGKSVLASTLIQHLMLEIVPVLYFFFRHTIEANHGPEALLRDWLAQILPFSPPLQLKLSAYTESNYNRVDIEELSMAELWRYLRIAMMDLPRAYCVVDALDEMDRKALEAFLHDMDALGQWRPENVKIIITSRPIAVVEQVLRKYQVLDVRLRGEKVEDDVSRYVQHRLEVSALSPELRLEVQAIILARAGGLFLYAKLALDTVFQADTENQIRSRLEEMPVDLTVMYTNLLNDHSARAGIPASLQELVLQLVTHATRPLRLIEIAELVRIERSPDENLGKVKELIRSTCGPLLEILPDETVRVIHHSLTEYLNGITPVSHDRPFPVFEAGTVNMKLAKRCLRYLVSGCLDKVEIQGRITHTGDVHYVEPATLVPNQLLPHFVAYAGSEWPVHVRRASAFGQDNTEINDMIDEIFAMADLEKLNVLAKTRIDRNPSRLCFAIALDLHDYAKRLVFRDGEMSGDGLRVDSDLLLLYAVEKSNEFIVKLILDSRPNIQQREVHGWTALHMAVKAGHVGIVTLLLDAGIPPDTESGPDLFHGMPGEQEIPWTPSALAFSHGSLDMAMVFRHRLQTDEELLYAFHKAVIGQNYQVIRNMSQDSRIDVNAKVDDTTALYKAASKHDAQIVRLLLQAGGANPNILHTPLNDGSTYADFYYSPFEELDIRASGTGRSNVTTVNVLSEGLGRNALHALTQEPYPPRHVEETPELLECLALLLQHGANVHQVDAMGNTPLHLVRNAAMASALLEAGADANAVNLAGETLMHLAYMPDVLAALVPQAQMNIESQNNNETPLLSALLDHSGTYESDERRIIKANWLIDHGADATAADSLGNTALHLAVGLRDIEKFGLPLIERLCSVKELVNQQNCAGKTPLHMNGPGSGRRDSMGHDGGVMRFKVYETLIAAGADPGIRDNQGRTPLFQFIEGNFPCHPHNQSDVLNRMVRDESQVTTIDARGRTLLHAVCSAEFVQRDLLDLLLGHGLDPKALDYDGNTLLHEVAPKLAKNRASLADFRNLSIDPLQRNVKGRTALHVLTSFRPAAFDPCQSYFTGGRLGNADDASAFGKYLELYDDVDLRDTAGVTPLHVASTFSEYLTINLLAAGANARQATGEGLTPLHLAARSRKANIIGLLIEHLGSSLSQQQLPDVLNAKDSLNRTALYYAAASGHEPSVTLLIDAGASTYHEDYDGSPWNGCADFESELIVGDWSRQCDADWRNRRKRKRGSSEVDAGGVMISDHLRPERVIHGHRNTDPGFPVERLDEIVDVLLRNMDANTAPFVQQALDSAFKNGHMYTAKVLLRASHNLQVPVEPQPATEIQEASLGSANGAVNGESDPELNFTEAMAIRDYAAARHFASEVNYTKRMSNSRDSILLNQLTLGGFTEFIADPATDEAIASREWQRDRDDRTGAPDYSAFENVHPLIILACRREEPNIEMLKALVEKKHVDVNARMVEASYAYRELPNGPNALHALIAGGHWWQVNLALPYLVKCGADLEVKDNQGLTPLGIALESINGPHFNKKAVELLLSLSANPNETDRRGKSYLSMTVKHKEVFELFISNGAVIDQPTMVAVIVAEDVDLLRTMLDGGADPNLRKVGREEPQRQINENSFTLRRYDPNDISETYLIDFLSGKVERDGSAKPCNIEMMHLLIARGGDPFAHYEKTTILHNVVQNRRSGDTYSSGMNPYLDILLATPTLDLETRDSNGMTILLLAGARRFGVGDEEKLDLIRKLVSLGADVNARDNKGMTVLHHLCSTGPASNEGVEFVISQDRELLHATDNTGKTSLHHSLLGRCNVADALITLGANARHADAEGETPLHIILKRAEWTVMLDNSIKDSSWLKVFERITGLGADMNVRNTAGETPLFAFFRSGVVTGEAMLPPPTESEAGIAKHGGHPSDRRWEKIKLERSAGIDKEHVIWKLFEQHGADWSIHNAAGKSLLHIVAEDIMDEGRDLWVGRRVGRFKFLLGKGLDPLAEDSEHRTPLDIAAKLGLEDILRLFQNNH